MASFPTTVAPSYGARKTSKPNVVSVEFGSGYSQRISFGLNQDLKKWSLEWENITETEADEMEAFLEARKGTESFTFTPPGEGSSSNYICSEWRKNLKYPTLCTFTCAFEEVAEA